MSLRFPQAPLARANALFALGVMVLASLGVAGFLSVREVERAAELRVQNYLVLDQLDDVRTALLDVETGARGFALTGQAEFLDSFDAGRRGLAVALPRVRELIAGDADQERQLSELGKTVRERLQHSERVVATRREEGPEAAQRVTATGEGRRTVGAARRLLETMDEHERRSLRERDAAGRRAGWQNFFVMVAAGVVAIASLVVAFVSYRSESGRRAHAEAGLQQSNTELEARIRARTEELGHSNTQLRQKLEDLERAEHELRGLLAAAELSRRSLLGLAEDQQRAEDALRESGERLAGVVGSAMDAIISVDAGQRIVLFNSAAEKMFGRPAGEAIGQSLDLLLPARFRAGHARHVAEFASSGVTTRSMGALGAISGVRANGEEFPIEASISQVDVGGATICTVILRDITERNRAQEALRRSREEMQALARHLEVIREEQATRIARELHDELGQALTILKLHVRSLQKKLEARPGEPAAVEGREAIELIDGAVRSVRHLCTELRPPMLDHLGLRPAIEALAVDFQAHSGIGCNLRTAGELPTLDVQRQTTLYRLVQELLTNVARHAGATEVRIELREKDGAIELEVADNGRGIAPEKMAGTGSLGLLGMRERALAAGGTITLEGRPGLGTTARARLPLEVA